MDVDFHDFVLEGLDDAEGDEDGGELLLADGEVPEPLGELEGEVVEEERDEPLEDPHLVGDVGAPQLLADLGQLLLQQDPEQLAVEGVEGEAVLVQPDRQDALVQHQLGEQVEALLLLAPRHHQEPRQEVEALRVAQLREVEGELAQYFFELVEVVLAAEERQFGVGAGHVLGDLREAGVRVGVLLPPELPLRHLHAARDAQLVPPQHPVPLRAHLLRQEARLLARLAVEEVSEVVRLDFV